MAQPTPYSRQYNFSDFQTSSPSDPLPATQVETELNSVLGNLSGLNSNIGKIQRDDGKLKNQSVHKSAFDTDSLALMGLSGFTVKGSWASATAYVVGDLVDYNSATYIATTGFTSNASFTVDSNAGRWILLANAALSTVGTSVDKFEGNGSATQFNLTQTYTSTTEIMVFVNGALKNPTDDYTIAGSPSVLTLGSPPSAPSVSGNENVIVFGTSVLVMAAKNAAETASNNASGFATNSATSAVKSENYAVKVDGAVPSTSDHSSKSWAVGGVGVTDTSSKGASKEWATKTSSTVDTSEFSSKEYAQGTQSSTGGSSKSWATKTSGAVDSSEYSSKEYAIGTNVAVGSSKDWATQTSGAVDTSEYSSKEYAQGTQNSTGGSAKSWSQDADQVNGAGTNDRSAKSWAQGSNMTGATLGGSSKDWAQLTGSTVDGTNYSAKYWATQANVAIVAGLQSEINILAPIASDITDVKNDAADIGAVALKATEIGVLASGSHLANITTVTGANGSGGTVRGDIETLAPRATDIGTLAPKASQIQQVSNVATDVTIVAHLEDGTTATSAISNLANRNSDIQTLAPRATDMQTLSPKATEIGRLGASSSIVTNLQTLGTTDAVGDMNSLAAISSDISSLANALEQTYTVTVAQVGGQNTFHLNGSISGISVFRGNTYFFNQDASSNDGHPLVFLNTTSPYDVGVTYKIDGSTVTKSQYTNTTTFNAGTTRSVEIEVDTTAPSSGLNTSCSVHGGGMGQNISVTDSNITLVANGMTNINLTATSIGAVNNVSTEMAKVTNVHNNMSDVNALNGTDVLTNIATLATGQTGGLSNLGSIALINVGSNMANINTTVNNINDVNNFANKYRIASSAPTSNNDVGDLYYNSSSNKLFVWNGSAWQEGVTAGSGFAQLSGATFTGNVKLEDNDILRLGDSNDMQIQHYNGNNFIEGYTGTFYISQLANDQDLALQCDNQNGGLAVYVRLDGSTGETKLYHASSGGSSIKLTTKSTGIDVSGTVTDDGATHNGDVTFTGLSHNAVWDKSANALEFGDDAKATFGAGTDLTIRHQSSNNTSYIEETGSGDLVIKGDDTYIQNQAGSQNIARFVDGGGVKLFYQGIVKAETVSAGFDVTGNLLANSFTLDATTDWNFETSGNDLVIKNGSTTLFKLDNSGNLTVAGDIITDGSL